MDPTEPPVDDAPPAATPPERRAQGPLRSGPSADAPRVDWRPPEAEGPTREVGTLEQRVATRRDPRLRLVMGIPALQATGWILFILGGLIYLHALWATANAAILGRSAEQTVRIAGTEFLQGSLGLALLVIGLLGALAFTFLPVRREPRLVPGTLEFEVAAEGLIMQRTVRRILMWSGVGVFLIGLVLAAWPLKQTVLEGQLHRVSIGGAGYRVHLWGYLVAATGIALAVPMAVTLGAMERAAAVAMGALTDGRVRRADVHEETAADERLREGSHGSRVGPGDERGDEGSGGGAPEGRLLGPPRRAPDDDER